MHTEGLWRPSSQEPEVLEAFLEQALCQRRASWGWGSSPVSLQWGSGLALRPRVASEGSPSLCSPAPSFLRELSDETVVLGQSVTLACQVLAQPAAQATWSKGKERS